MLLTVDIGNTMVHYGIFRGDRLIRYAQNLRGQTSQILRGLTSQNYTEAVVCSVVPEMRLELGVPTLFVNPKLDLGLKVYPKNVGSDRLANAVAVKFIYGCPAIVVDFGTAITIDVINKKGDYIGGVIMPGVDMIRYALNEKTALLPLVSFAKPKSILGQDTKHAIQSGLYYGIRGMIKELLAGLKKELKFSTKTVIISTGGNADLFRFGKVDKFLTLKGLQIIYERNRDNRGAFVCK